MDIAQHRAIDASLPSATAPTLEVTIQGLSFTIASRFAEMHICSAGDAAVLDAALCDHVRGAFAKSIKQLVETEAASGADRHRRDELQTQIADYAAEYHFAASRAALRDPVERAALRIAQDIVREKLNERGLRKENLAEGVWEARVAEVAKLPNVRAEAARRVEATKSVVAGAMDFE